MIWLYEHNLSEERLNKRATACVLAALSVGGMVLSRTVEDEALADEVREAARSFALAAVDQPGKMSGRNLVGAPS
jgi:hypothetical protein